MVWVWKIFPKNVKFFNFFASGQKNLFGSGQGLIGFLFTTSQKYAQVGAGQGPLVPFNIFLVRHATFFSHF